MKEANPFHVKIRAMYIEKNLDGSRRWDLASLACHFGSKPERIGKIVGITRLGSLCELDKSGRQHSFNLGSRISRMKQ